MADKRRVDLLDPGVDARLDGIRRGSSVFDVVAPAASAEFDLSEPITAGWHHVVLDRRGTGAIAPRLCFDFGAGFDEGFSIRLVSGGEGRRYRGTFKLPFPALRVRLESGEGSVGAAIEALTVERLPGPALALFLGGEALRRARRDPLGFARRVPFYLKALAGPYFHQVGKNVPDGTTYAQWIVRHDFDEHRDGPALESALAELDHRPLVSIVIDAGSALPDQLERAAASLLAQVYPDWELIVVAPGGRNVPRERLGKDERIRVLPASGDASLVEAMAQIRGEWTALVAAGDVLAPHALAEAVLEIGGHPEAEVVYADEDWIDKGGRRWNPWFKPDFSRELFRSQNYLGHFVLHRRANVEAAGGWRAGFDDAGDYDIDLRVFERVGADAIRHIPKVLCHRHDRSPTSAEAVDRLRAAERHALEGHVERRRLPATVEDVPDTPFHRLHLRVPEPAPLVSLVIPTRDRPDLLRPCVSSIRERTDYANYEVIVVDNGSREPATLACFRDLEEAANVRVIGYGHPFNYSAINNFAVAQARGAVVGLVNDDIEVISPGWLTEMVSWAVRPDVGCVGAKLLYGDGTVQHAGMVTGVGMLTDHAFRGLTRHDPGYFGRAAVVSNVSAVTGACLLVRKALYEEMGGLNETDLPVAFNDVDFCLRLVEAGYRSVWTPFAELYHHESASRGADDKPDKFLRHLGEIRYMRERWGERIARDPYYSVNLSRRRADFTIGE